MCPEWPEDTLETGFTVFGNMGQETEPSCPSPFRQFTIWVILGELVHLNFLVYKWR